VHDLRDKLRAATADDHRRTEAGFAASLAALPDSYPDFLKAHAMAFPAVGTALSAALDWAPWTGRWIDLESDLAGLGVALPRPIALAPAASRAEALGMAYVLEGSRMGSAILLRQIPADLPSAYLAGGRDRAPWLQLLTLLQSLAPDAESGAIAGARAAFAAFRRAAEAQRTIPQRMCCA
jgi:heme oxygenase